ncbi:FN3 associated domain-containing protein [uncultured Clostridium sp.]|uniref:FN3 associated domain-containing protein n=1 Tax=uncultured Clostridium sp. TaxID=59620 RepID=UPI0028E48C02|nr:FN3 associated domain-containing protein [uncultured Clostridium sp.]
MRKKVILFVCFFLMLVQSIANAAVISGASYYYTTDGSTPSATHGTLWDGTSKIQITPPDTDNASSVTVKMIGVENGYSDSDIATTTINFKAKDTAATDVNDVTITLNKTDAVNRYDNAIAFISNKSVGATYYYTLDGTDPSPTNGTLLNSSYIKIPVQDTDNETTVIVSVKGYSNSSGFAGNTVSNGVTFAAKSTSTHTVTFKDKNYNDITTETVADGTSVVSILSTVTPPSVDGYSFSGWSIESGTVTSDMIIRALYDKNSDTLVDATNVQVINNGSTGPSSILITGRYKGEHISVYKDNTKSDLKCEGDIDSNGECEMSLTLPDSAGSLYVIVTSSNNNVTYSSTTPSNVTVSNIVASDTKHTVFSMAFGDVYDVVKETKVYYQAPYITQSYSQAILPSRCYLGDDNDKLIIKDLNNGDLVKVYDINNNVIGTGTSDGSGNLIITLPSDITDSSYIFVSRTSPGLLESPQTELTLDILNSNSALDDANKQNVNDVVTAIKNILDNYEFTNDTTASELQSFLNSVISNPNYTINIDTFNMNQSTDSAPGSIAGTITVSNSSDSTQNQTFDFSGDIARLGDSTQTLDQAADAVKNAADNYKYKSSTTKDDIQNYLENTITNSDITVTVSNFSNNGTDVSYDIVVKDKSSGISRNMSENGLVTGNTTTGPAVGIGDDNNDGNTTTGPAVSVGSSSHHHHHSSGSSNDGTSSSSTDTSSSTSETSTGKEIVEGNGTNSIPQDTIKDVDSKGTKYTDGSGNTTTVLQVYNSNNEYIGSVIKTSGSKGTIGSGVGAGGSADTSQYLYKYESITGKYIEIPNGLQSADNNMITFSSQPGSIYFVSPNQLDKSLVLTQGWNIVNSNTYDLSGLDLATNWKSINGNWYYMKPVTANRVENNWILDSNSWYYLGTNGIMSQGWLSYNGNWYYLKPWSGVMASDWQQVGDNWYLFNSNGSMETGWQNINGSWYYLYGDGHMASNETVDGYSLGYDGSLVS